MAKVYQDPRSPLCAGRKAWFLDYFDLNGRRRREKTRAIVKSEAEALLRAKLSEIAKAQITGVRTTEELRGQTLDEFVRKEFLPWSEPPRNRPSTYQRKVQIAVHVRRHLGGIFLRAIGSADIDRFMAKRLKEKSPGGKLPSPAEVNRERSFLCSVFNMALRRGLVDRNPVILVRPLKEDNERDRTLSGPEEERILAFSPEWLRPIVLVALHTGMRESEILGMRWGDLDREDGFIRVSHASKAHKVRHVPINAVVRRVLDGQSPYIGPGGPSPFVFVNPETGLPYQSDSVYHAFVKSVKNAGVENVVFHTLRHTCVSRLVRAGVPDRKIMKMIGHSSPHMVSRYAHLAPDSLQGVADVLVESDKPRKRVLSGK